MRYTLSYVLYYIGDIISRTFMVWGRGYGYKLYSKIMLWSVDLDQEGKIWKYVKDEKENL